jgi:hypothetical protein
VFVVRRVVRRARGDPHFVGKKGEKNEQYTGVFTWFKSATCNIQVRYSRLHRGAIISGIAGKCGNESFLVTKKGARANGRKLKRPFLTPALRITQRSSSEIVVSSPGAFRANIIIDRRTRSVSINFEPQTSNFEGLSKNGHQTDHKVAKENSLFKRFVTFKRLDATPDQTLLPKAQKWCRRVSKKLRPDCQNDVMLTGINWSHLYKLEKRLGNKGLVKRRGMKRVCKAKTLKCKLLRTLQCRQ